MLALAACALALAGCETLRGRKPPPPPPAPVEAPVQPTVPRIIPPPPAPPPAPKVSCVPKTLPRAPKYPDTDAALREAGGAADRYQLMAAGRLLRMQRLAELEKTVEGCR